MPEDKELKEAMQSEDKIKLPKKNKSNKTLIVVVILLATGLIGMGIYGYLRINSLNKSIKDKDATISDLQNKKKTLEDAAAVAAKAAINAVSTNYLEVKELGYKLPLSDDIKDLQYFVNGKTTFFSTQSLQSSAWAVSNGKLDSLCSIGSLPLGSISKFSSSADAGPTVQKALAGFVLGYAGPQATCSSSQTVNSLQTKQRSALEKAFNNAEKI